MFTTALQHTGTSHPPVAKLHDDTPALRSAPSQCVSDVFELVSTRAAFDALETDWNALFARAAKGTQLFQSFNWLWHWATIYGPADAGGSTLAIATVRRNGRLVLVWPMVVERIAGVRQLAWMGDPVSQYGDILVDDVADKARLIATSWQRLIAAVRADAARLAKVRADAAVRPFLATLGARIIARAEAPYADLAKAGSFEQFQKRFPAKTIKNRRRHCRRLEERGAFGVERHCTGIDAANAISIGITLKRAWLNAKGLVSRAFADNRIEAFFQATLSARQRSAGVSVSVLRSCGEAADVSVFVDAKDRRALHIMAYSLKFEKMGPGNVHLEQAVSAAYADGVAIFDFMAPRHDYKMEWADGVVAVEDLAVALSLPGRIYIAAYLGGVREGLKTVAKALPKGVGRFLAGAHRRTHGLFLG